MLLKPSNLETWRIFAVMVFATACSVNPAIGDKWTSPDGVIVVTAPDAAEFHRVDPPPESFLVLWSSKDETLRLGVIKLNVPANVTLIRSSTEEGLAEEIGGAITASSSTVKNGHEIWIMTAEGSPQGTHLQITQALVQYKGHLYKAMAAAVGDGPTDDTTIDTFVNSLEVTPSNLTGDPAPNAPNNLRSKDGISMHNLSKRIGGAGLLLLIGLTVWRVTRRSKPKP